MTGYVDPNDQEVIRFLAGVEDSIRRDELKLNSEIVSQSAHDLRERIEELWDKGMPPGDRTGWPSLDRHYTVAPGQLTIVTGWPSSGKSEWVDALLMNLARRQGWRFALYSPENAPAEVHAVKMLEKLSGKPFADGPTERMGKEEAIDYAELIAEWFGFIVPNNTTDRTNFSADEILAAAEGRFRALGSWHDRLARKGLVIDPWNELEHLRPRELNETEYISQTLSKVRGWGRKHNIHVWIVAHPQKLRRDDNGKLPVPTPDSISGSQHWWNKADNAITVWRELGDGDARDDVKIYVQKVRFKHIGRPGIVDLRYNRVTGQYAEHEPSMVPAHIGRKHGL